MDNSLIENFSPSVSKLRKAILAGRNGENLSIPIGIDGLDDEIQLRRQIKITIGGESGTGKTAFADDLFVLRPFFNWRQNRLMGSPKRYPRVRWLYFSMERSTTFKLAKWLCWLAFMVYGRLLDIKKVLSFDANNRLSDEDYRIVDSLMPILEELQQYVTFYDGAKTTPEILTLTASYMNGKGRNISTLDQYDPYSGEYTGKVLLDGINAGEFNASDFIMENGRKRHFKDLRIGFRDKPGELLLTRVYQDDRTFLDSDPEEITFVVQDHVGKTIPLAGQSEKACIDQLSAGNGAQRDYYGTTPIEVSQWNRNVSQGFRVLEQDLKPQKSDWKGTGNVIEDCDIALGITNPFAHQVMNHLGYNIGEFTNLFGINRFRALWLVKNTFGADNVVFPMNFIGEAGVCRKLRPASQITNAEYDMARNAISNIKPTT